MESKKMIRIAMRLTESIIEILKKELANDEKGRRKNAHRKKTLVKRSS